MKKSYKIILKDNTEIITAAESDFECQAIINNSLWFADQASKGNPVVFYWVP